MEYKTVLSTLLNVTHSKMLHQY